MRGKSCCNHLVVFVNGITPACAGKRACTTTATTRPKDHPRMCGEKPERIAPSAMMPGSPPRMRGKVIHDGGGLFGHRITPAHAGKSSRVSSFLWLFWDHPRACGEKLVTTPGQKPPFGSPPRMRGKDKVAFVHRGQQGITPAHAGKSSKSRIRRTESQDHPRACGEKPGNVSGAHNVAGSPPRMRGKVLPPLQCGLYLGITPAHAGKRGTI